MNNYFTLTKMLVITYNPRTSAPLSLGPVTSALQKEPNAVDKKPKGFNYKMNDLRFSYSVPYFEKIDHVQYRFILEGFEDAWSAWTFKTEKEYTNLASGDYHFRVIARNAYGQVSSEAVYEFTIFPPWYFSWYAQVAYFILGIILITGLIKVVTKREQKKTVISHQDGLKPLTSDHLWLRIMS